MGNLMKEDRYTSLPSWPISLEELMRLLNRDAIDQAKTAADERERPHPTTAFTLDCIAQQAPWFNPEELQMDRAVHPLFRKADELPE